MGHLFNDILAKLDTIVQNETMMNDFCNAVISIIESNEKNLRKRKKPWSLSEKKYRLKNLFNTYAPTEKLFMQTYNDNKILTTFSEICGMLYPKYDFEINEGILGKLDKSRVSEIVSKLNSDGYYIFENRLSEEFCDRIISHLNKVDFWTKNKTGLVRGINPSKFQSNTYIVNRHQDVADMPETQELILDPTLLNVCQDFLNCAPILTSCNAWCSVNYKKDRGELSRAAQLFHQDMEFIKFIKIFIYLTDVDEKHGPHAYVPGSARNLKHPDKHAVSQRLSDEYIREQYGDNAIKEHLGKKGTIIIEDTSGYHKGKPLDEGHRIIYQLEFACSLFVGKSENVATRNILYSKKNFSPRLKQFIAKYPRLFSQHYLN